MNGADGISAGSGGSLYIEASQVTGSGTLTCNGGRGIRGGGAGGRIAIYAVINSDASDARIQANGEGKASSGLYLNRISISDISDIKIVMCIYIIK